MDCIGPTVCPSLFQERWGYDLIENLPSLVQPVGDWKRVRHNYYNLLLEQFIEHWSKPCYEYCESARPGVHGPLLGARLARGRSRRRQHGDVRLAPAAGHRHADEPVQTRVSTPSSAMSDRSRSSPASPTNSDAERTLCEAYGAGGWDLRFEDMKRIGDWLYVLGVNTLDEHLSYITIRGARKRDHPQSFSYHEPWWEAYHVMAEYFTRLSLVMSQGRQINRVLVIEPTTTTWMYQGQTTRPGKLGEIGNRFQAMVMDLEGAQAEYDIGCEDIIGRIGSVEGAQFRVGHGLYDTSWS